MQGSTASPEVSHDHAALEYYAESARHAFKVAPLPEFADVLTVLEEYRNEPNSENKGWLQETLDRLRSTRHTRRNYGYTAIGQYHAALVHIIENVLSGLDVVSMSDTFLFTEAVYCAARALGVEADAKQRLENEYQDGLWKRVVKS